MHALESLPMTSPKDLIFSHTFSWQTESVYQIPLKSDKKWQQYREHKPKNKLNCK